MKQILKFSFAMFIAGVILTPAAFAQRKTTAQAVNIAGKINLDDNYVAILTDMREPGSEAVEIPITKAGTFAWKSDIQSAGFLEMSVIPKSRKRQLALMFPLYVQPGQQLQLNLNYNDSTYLSLLPGKIDGDNKALIEYSNFSFLKMRDIFRNRPNSAEKIKSAILPYIMQADQYVADFRVKNQSVRQYIDVWAMNNYMSNLFGLSRGLARNSNEGGLPADYYTFPKSPEVVYNHDVAMLLNQTSGNINQYLAFVNKGASIHQDAFEQSVQRFKQIEGMFTNKQLINNLVTASLNDFIRRYSFKPNANFDDEIAKFKQLTAFVNDEKRRAGLEQRFGNLRYTLKGASLPDVAFKDVNGKEIKLQSFSGKCIYIDLWASWCKPCIAEIPNLHKLEADYKDKNVVFVSISVDADKNDWREKMAELKLEGHQLELGDSAYDDLMNVSGIPHFILYDPSGKLVAYKAPRPGTAEIRTMLDRLLK